MPALCMAPATRERVRRLDTELRALPQIPIATDHVLHAGMYARTIRIPAGVVLTGVCIRVATTLVIHGRASLATDGAPVEIDGHAVLPASAHRCAAIHAHADTVLTMIFPTSARTIEEAEDQFAGPEAERLISRQPGAVNSICITGE